ncbi:hypothetical protein H5410_005582 [Solanum commersonii]|uniref:Uncharacterized protein n=1 Tax=Solanum commersonii TaxID=4109 RepID=A0A9J6A7Y2_SOLCO|nr:hypothetical protein H5410_005582 [Solanum commersonii]
MVMPFCSGNTCKSGATKLDQFLKFLLEHAINLEKLCLLLFPTTYNSAIISSGPVTQNISYS